MWHFVFSVSSCYWGGRFMLLSSDQLSRWSLALLSLPLRSYWFQYCGLTKDSPRLVYFFLSVKVLKVLNTEHVLKISWSHFYQSRKCENRRYKNQKYTRYFFTEKLRSCNFIATWKFLFSAVTPASAAILDLPIIPKKVLYIVSLFYFYSILCLPAA